MLKEDSSDKRKATFLQEAAIMAQFRHPHIVRLLGAVTVDEPVSCEFACVVALSSYCTVYVSCVQYIHERPLLIRNLCEASTLCM